MGAEEYLSGVLEGQLVTRGDTIPLSIMGQRVDLVVISTAPSGPVIINSSTQVYVSEETAKAGAAVKEGGIPSNHL
jgi:transitional endoplasmic reticulum ATPase